MYFLNPLTQEFNHFPAGGRNGKNYDVRSLLMDDNTLWIGTSGSGLLVMDTESDRVKSYTHSKDIPNTICSNEVLAIYKVRNGDIYVGTSWGLCRYDKTNDHFITITAVGMMVSIVDIHEDSQGYLWIATTNSGVFRVNIETGIWKHFHHQVGNKSSIISNSVISLLKIAGELCGLEQTEEGCVHLIKRRRALLILTLLIS